jgi:hypothetical protein
MTEPKTDCEAVMNSGFPLAEELLKQNGEFLPFGMAMQPNRDIICLGAYDGRGHQALGASQTEMVRTVRSALIAGARREEYMATALFYDARITLGATADQKDAIAIALHHRDGYAVMVLMPYQFDSDAIVFDSPQAQAAEFDIFSAG